MAPLQQDTAGVVQGPQALWTLCPAQGSAPAWCAAPGLCVHTHKHLIVGNLTYIKHLLVAMKDGILPEFCMS